jgi:citrate lyase subunit beta/citryl-CoA lyase
MSHIPATNRPRRSVLYVPASNARAIEKARKLPCDAVILDLEDAVAPDLKSLARESASAALRAGGFGQREIIVRVNGLDTEWGPADLEAARHSPADAVLVPKIHTAQDVLKVDRALTGAPGSLQVWAMIETARSVLRLEEIAAASEGSRLTGLVLGTNDLGKELRMHLDADRKPLAAILALTVAAARAYGLTVLDGVYNTFDDETGFEAQCRQGLEYGFDGKTLIHPRQIEPCNSVYAPSEQAIAWAHRIRTLFAEPGNASKGALSLDGVMVERLHLAQAERLLALDAAIRARRND